MGMIDQSTPRSGPTPSKTNRIDAIEIAAMRNLSQHVGDPDREIVTIRPVKPGETPDLWTVIARLSGGRGEVLADEDSRRAAFAFARRFRRKLVGAEVPALSLRSLEIIER